MPQASINLLRTVAAMIGSVCLLGSSGLLHAQGHSADVHCVTQRVTLPILLGDRSTPVQTISVTVSSKDSTETLTDESDAQRLPHLRELDVSLAGTDQATDLESISIHRLASDGSLQWPPLASLPAEPMPERLLRLDLNAKTGALRLGENRFGLAVRLRPTANLDHRISVGCDRVLVSNGQRIHVGDDPVPQRFGIALRSGGQDDVDTYRIPGLATTNQGTLIAVYDVRRANSRDLPADIDVGMSRSLDGGRNWEPMQIIMDMGDDPAWSHDGIGDPAVLVDRERGTIWVAGLWSHGPRGWHGSGPGIAPEQTGQMMLVRSDDDGQTWSEPINITSQVKRPEWCLLLQGPGKGISMSDGTLVFAAQFQDAESNGRLPHSTIVYSQDHGKTWHCGHGAFPDTTEAQIVETHPGVLMLNCRYNRKPFRVVMTTDDLGRTWKRHPTSETTLSEPGACMASLIKLSSVENRFDSGAEWLLFSNPDSRSERSRMMVKASPDLGQHWPQSNRVLLDEGRSFGYSCMTQIDSETLGVLYEGSRADLIFQRIPLHQMLAPSKDRP
ncbi:glycosyl hydrolase [Roseiconus nitratireducens]|uniref:exo-alpha-sialidase n=1 Tax=Roseiconus nitratireducens TaxID=2605748 RepID=A0A5M6D463_9BACT|nr:sialidase family protein [Roseiconus nitratireducens]KAA5540529.1 glycosyl hydrolase [Roseiconus nitratireducens]